MTTLRRPIIAFATFMGTVAFYIALLASIVASTVAVAALSQDSPVAIGIIYGMSAFSLIQCGAILVKQHEDENRAHHRDDALHLKINEIVRAIDGADNAVIGIEVEDDVV